MKLELRRRRGLVADGAVVVFLALVCCLFFWQVLTPDPTNRRWFAAGDFTDQFYAFRTFQAQELWSGRLPLWNPYTFGGAPFLADLQAAVYYPMGLLTVLLAGKSGLPLIAVEIEAIVHYFLASLFTYLLVKRLTGSRLAGVVSGIVYAYGSYLTAYPKLQMAILEGQTWVPLALLAVQAAAEEERRGNKGRSKIRLVAGGAVLALSLLAGHGQTFLLAAYLVGGYLAFAFFPLWQAAPKREKAKLVARAALLPLVAGGLTAAQLLPSLEYMRLSTRAQLGFAQASGGFMFSDLAALFLPGLRVIYTGILPLLLAAVALVLRRGRETTFWGIAAGLSLLLSLGGRTAVYKVLYVLGPGFRFFQGQERALQVFSLSIAILAGYGMAVLARPMAHEAKHRFARFFRLVLWANVAAWALAVLAYWGAANWAQPEAGQVNDLLERSVLLVVMLGLGTLVLWLRLGGRPRPRRLGLLAVAVILFDLFSLNWGNDLERARARDRFLVSAPIQFLQSQPGAFRVWNGDGLPGNFGVVWQLEETAGISPLRLQRYEDFVRSLPEERARRLLNVHYAISPKDSLPDGELVEEYSQPDKGAYLYRIREPGSAAYMVYSALVEPDEAQALERLAEPDFDPSRQVILADSPPLPALTGSGQGEVRLVERSPDRLAVDVQTDADGILVLSEIAYPGWRATVDGQEVPILRANTVLRAVALRAGSHRVEMVFRPATAYAGVAISGLVLIAAAIAVAAWRAPARRGQGRPGRAGRSGE